MSTVAQIFARTLKEIGVRFVFGVPSGNMTDYIEALRCEDGIDFVLVGNETTAAFMAGVCGRLTGVPGVCFGTFGPGATNLSTGVGGAFLDRFPLIAFTDEMPDHLLNRKVQMNIDHQALFEPITKWTTRFDSGNVNEIILKAAGIAVSEVPGPVHIGVPAGIGMVLADETDNPINYLRLEKVQHDEKLFESVKQADLVFQKSKKPLIAIGLSAVRFQTKYLIIQLAEKFNIPVLLTPMAKGLFPENHPLYAGVLFHALSNYVAETYREADLVIGIGYDPVEFNYEEWMPRVPLIHFDSQPADIDREEYPEVIDVTGNLNDLLERFVSFQEEGNNWNREILMAGKEEIFRKLTPAEGSFGPLSVVDELRNVLPEDGILTVDVGAHLHLIGQMWRTPVPEKLLMTNGWSSMGFAVPAALAAKMCYPGLPVAVLMGDGGFLMTVGELATAKRLNLKIVFVVIYDNSLSLIRIKQGKKNYDNHYGTDLNELPVEPTNHYFGVPVIRATNRDEYQIALKQAFSFVGPTVIEAVVEGSEYDDLVLKSNK
jgi:acetolactate synthase I/II/III large subunit